MSRTLRLVALSCALAAPVPGVMRPARSDEPAPARDEARAEQRPRIEVCFVLDTTGSMGGLIDGAKQKIWSIANTIIAVKDKPQIKISLIGYRDRGDAYVTKVFDLTDDIDAVFKNLQAFEAGGGGDGPESVNQALHEAVTKVSWSGDKGVSKIIFLVGDAPPHMDYKDDTKYADACQAAVRKDIIVNTVQCGSQGDTTTVWKEIARLGEGAYVSLGQTGDVVAIATPMDKEIAELSAKSNDTVLAYGRAEQRRDVEGKLSGSRQRAAAASRPAGASPELAKASREVAALEADRASFNLADGGKAVQGLGDLVFDCRNGVVKLEDLKEEDLPDELKKMKPAGRKAYIEKKAAEREKIQSRIAELSERRVEYIAAERKKQVEAGKAKADSFDEQVAEIVAKQRKK